MRNLGTRSTSPRSFVVLSVRAGGARVALSAAVWEQPLPPMGVRRILLTDGAAGAWVPPSTGRIPIVATIDEGNRVPERNEANNLLASTIAVG